MTIFDFIVFALIGASVVAGASRGLLRALITFAALIAGLVVAAQGYEAAGALLRGVGLVESKAAANAGGFLLIMTAALIAGVLVGRMLRGGLRHVKLEWFDRALGGAFGLLRGLAVCSVMYLALTAFPVRLEAVEKAETAPLLNEGARWLAYFTSSDLRQRLYEQYTGQTNRS
ncbi:MAG: rane protein required for colicin production [Blastocatellia bacterium]|jgi:membrane protein required for colicin V production|nr:rane protein required for colicin production [Blastocatellia bacterium]